MISRLNATTEIAERAENATGAPDAAGACPLACGPGACVRVRGAPACACPAAYAGARCQHYRCAAHCHRRGHCYAEAPANATHLPGDELPPLVVSNWP